MAACCLYRKILETIKEHEKNKDTDLAKAFDSELKVAKDGFAVVADYFGKGVFQRVSLVVAPSAIYD